MSREEQLEKHVFQKVVMNLENYSKMMKRQVDRMKQTFDKLSDNQKAALPARGKYFENVQMMVIIITILKHYFQNYLPL